MLSLARALSKRGVEVAVVAPVDTAAGSGPAGSEDGGVPAVLGVGRSVPVPANGSVAPLALGPAAWARTVARLRRWEPDIVHVHEPFAPLVGWAAATAAVPAARLCTLHRSGGTALYRLAAAPGRAMLRRFSMVVAVSDEARRTAAPVLGDRACPVVGNGIDLERFALAMPAPTGGPTVVFVGRHEPRKGLGTLLQAVELLGPTWPGTLWIVGQGPQTDELRRRFPPGPRRRWWGQLGDDDLAALLAGAHVLCAPSLGGESFGVVLLEAMAARTAVVCSAIAGYEAVLGGHGIPVPPGDPGALAAALDRAVAAVADGSGPGSPRALASAAAHAETFSMGALAGRYLDMYEDLATPSHHR